MVWSLGQESNLTSPQSEGCSYCTTTRHDEWAELLYSTVFTFPQSLGDQPTCQFRLLAPCDWHTLPLMVLWQGL